MNNFFKLSINDKQRVSQQASDVRKWLVLVPRKDIIYAWENDYKSICTSMIYGKKPNFSQLIERMRELERKFHQL